ncbi:hypothetical protein BDN72DRAFT_835517 [Pluteus cervinus]|uniref:Uncharacterized protein n=1 Tax=Pluteus cervinus TaxID=181527 RepID=A0ACD3B3L7_9AGAR|nr:hypothetical protein BDN72DRAFT_835517 [Pluteus cervinus]
MVDLKVRDKELPPVVAYPKKASAHDSSGQAVPVGVAWKGSLSEPPRSQRRPGEGIVLTPPNYKLSFLSPSPTHPIALLHSAYSRNMSLADPTDGPAPTPVLQPITNDPILRPSTEQAESVDALKEDILKENHTAEEVNDKVEIEPTGQVNNDIAEPIEPVLMEEKLIAESVVEERDLSAQANSATDLPDDKHTTSAVEVDIVVEKPDADDSLHTTVEEPTDATASVEPHMITKAVEPEGLDAQDTGVTAAVTEESSSVQAEEESVVEQVEEVLEEVVKVYVKSAQDDVTDASVAKLESDALADQTFQAQEELDEPQVEIRSETADHGLVEDSKVSEDELVEQPLADVGKEATTLPKEEEVAEVVETTKEESSPAVVLEAPPAEPVVPNPEVVDAVVEHAAQHIEEPAVLAAEVTLEEDAETSAPGGPVLTEPIPAEATAVVNEATEETKGVAVAEDVIPPTPVDEDSSPASETVTERVDEAEETSTEPELVIETAPVAELVQKIEVSETVVEVAAVVDIAPETAEAIQSAGAHEEQSSTLGDHKDAEPIAAPPAADLVVGNTSPEIKEEPTAAVALDGAPADLDVKEADVAVIVTSESIPTADPEPTEGHPSEEVSEIVDAASPTETAGAIEIASEPSSIVAEVAEVVSVVEGASEPVLEPPSDDAIVAEVSPVISTESDSGFDSVSELTPAEETIPVPETSIILAESDTVVLTTEAVALEAESVVDEVTESVSVSVVEEPAPEVIATKPLEGIESVVDVPLSADVEVEGPTEADISLEPAVREEPVVLAISDAAVPPVISEEHTEAPQEHNSPEERPEVNAPVEQVAPTEHVSEAAELELEVQNESASVEAAETTLDAQSSVVEDHSTAPWTPSFQVTTVGKGVSAEPSTEDVTHEEETVESEVKREQDPEEEQIVPLSVSDTSAPHVEDAHEAPPPEGGAAVETAPEVPTLGSTSEIPRPWTPSYAVHSQGTPSLQPTELPAEPQFEEPSTSAAEVEPVVSPSPKDSLDASHWTPSYSIHSQGSPRQPAPEIPLDGSQDTTPDVCLEDSQVVQTDELPPMEFAQNAESQARVEKEETAPILITESAENGVVAISESEGPSQLQVDAAEISSNSAPRSPIVILEDVESGISTPLLAPGEIQEEVPPNAEQETDGTRSPSWVHSYSVSSQGSPPVDTPLEPALSPSRVFDAPATPEIPSIEADVTATFEEVKSVAPPPVAIHAAVSDEIDDEVPAADPEAELKRPKSPWVPSYSVENQGSSLVPEAEVLVEQAVGHSTAQVEEAIPATQESANEPETVPVSVNLEAQRPKSPWVSSYSVDTQGAPQESFTALPPDDPETVVVTQEESLYISSSEVLDDARDSADAAPEPEQTKSLWVPSYTVSSQGSPAAQHAALPSVESEIDGHAQYPSAPVEDVPPIPEILSTDDVAEVLVEQGIGESNVQAGEVAGATPATQESASEPEVETGPVTVDPGVERPKSPWVSSYSVNTQGTTVTASAAPPLDDVEDTPLAETVIETQEASSSSSEVPQTQGVADITQEAEGHIDAQDSADVAPEPEQTQSLWVPSYSVSSQGSPATQHVNLPSVDDEMSGQAQDPFASPDDEDPTSAPIPPPVLETTPEAVLIEGDLEEPVGSQAVEEDETEIERPQPSFVQSYSVSAQGSPRILQVDTQEAVLEVTPPAEDLALAAESERPKSPWISSYSVNSQGSPGVPSTDLLPEVPTAQLPVLAALPVASGEAILESTEGLAEIKETSVVITPVADAQPDVEHPKSSWVSSYSVNSQGSPGVASSDLPTEVSEIAVLAAVPTIAEVTEELAKTEGPTLITALASEPPSDVERPKSPWVSSYSVNSQGSPAAPVSDISPEVLAALPMVDGELAAEINKPLVVIAPAIEAPSDVERPKSPWVPSYSVDAQGSSGVTSPDLAPEVLSSQVDFLAAVPTANGELVNGVSEATSGVVPPDAESQPDHERPKSPWVSSYSVNSQGSAGALPSDVTAEVLPTPQVNVLAAIPTAIRDVPLEPTEEIPEVQVPSVVVVPTTEAQPDIERPKSPWVSSYSVNSQGSPALQTGPLPSEVAITAPSPSSNEPSAMPTSEAEVDRPKSPWAPSYSINTQGSPAMPQVELVPEVAELEATTLFNLGANKEADQEILEAPAVVGPVAAEARESEDPLQSSWVPSYSVNSQGSPAVPPSDLGPEVVVSPSADKEIVVEAEPELERPKSPWVPSYSVETQGSPAVSSSELPPVGVESAESSDPSNIDVKPSLTMLLNDKSPAERDESGVSRSITPVNDAEVTERPKSPWTPSYSVTRQGSATDADLDKLEQLPPAIVEAAVTNLSEVIPVQDETDTPTPKPEQAVEPPHRYKVIGAFPLTPSTSNSFRTPLPPLDENGVDDEVAPIAASSSIPRPRVESAASSRFFPGAWLSTPSKVVDQGRASLDIAQGEFTPSKPSSPIAEQVSEFVNIATVTTATTASTSSIINEEISVREKRARWCLIM